MIDSILESIKKPLGLDEDYDVFDEDITMHINSVFSALHSIGASPPEPFMLITGEEKWSDFLLDVKQAAMVKSYVYLKVRMIFDPPPNSFALDALKKQADEWEWRLSILEFVFNPDSKPVDYIADNKQLRHINTQLEALDNKVDELDDKVDDLDEENNVPDLTTIFQQNLEN